MTYLDLELAPAAVRTWKLNNDFESSHHWVQDNTLIVLGPTPIQQSSTDEAAMQLLEKKTNIRYLYLVEASMTTLPLQDANHTHWYSCMNAGIGLGPWFLPTSAIPSSSESYVLIFLGWHSICSWDPFWSGENIV